MFLAGLPFGSICLSVVVAVCHSIWCFLYLDSLEGILFGCLAAMGSQRENVGRFFFKATQGAGWLVVFSDSAEMCI